MFDRQEGPRLLAARDAEMLALNRGAALARCVPHVARNRTARPNCFHYNISTRS